ncbi:MAG: hypothetical protein K1060chlam1_00680 [Candidatus Anoxychlamydiales bacterium]|nr:hypothetical protein [Candidatus Anoxychlamydiales bacterium]
MFLKLKNVFFVLITMLFCMNVAHADSENTKRNKNHLFKFQKVSKKKKSKNKELFSQTNRKFKTSLKNSNNKILPIEEAIEISQVSLDCDSTFSDLEIESSILRSNYGFKMMQNLKNLFENIKNIYLDTVSDLDCDVNVCLDDFFPYLDTEVNISEVFEDFEKIFLMHDYINREDMLSAENIAADIKTAFIRNMTLEGIFNAYLINNQIQNAKRIYSMMDFDLDDEDGLDELSEITDKLIIALMRNGDLQEAEKIAFNMPDEDYREYDLKLIVKHLSRRGDIDNAKRIIEKISQDYNKKAAQLYIVEYFAREKKIVDFQKFVISSDDEEFKKSANFILNIYQNDFDLAETNMPYDYEAILENIAEVLVSSNRIKEAEYLINYFGDEYDREEFELFFVNAYLKSGQIDEAKRVRNEIEDPFDKIIASRLIAAFTRG